MAKQMSFETEQGFTAEESFWVVTFIENQPNAKSLYAIIGGYKSEDDFNNGKQSISAKSYRVTDSATYDAYFDESVLSGEGVTLQTQIYQYATDTEDTGGASFFASALDV
jgi:hypothetical protein